MLKKTILGLAVGAVMALGVGGSTAPAEAGVSIGLYGYPVYQQYGHDYYGNYGATYVPRRRYCYRYRRYKRCWWSHGYRKCKWRRKRIRYYC